jgi:hypothetical protein
LEKFLTRHLSQRIVESQQNERIESALLEKSPALAEVGETRRRGIRGQILSRHRLEAHDQRWPTFGSGARQGSRDQCLMAAMYPIETADGDDTAAKLGGYGARAA